MFLGILFIVVVVVVMIVNSHPIIPEDNINNNIQSSGMDLSYLGENIYGHPDPNVGDKLFENWNKSDINPEEFGEYSEGDILFPKKLRNGLVAEISHWPNGYIPYEIKGPYQDNDKKMILKAMEIYHKYTCIKFKVRTPQDKDYISIINGNSGCWSSVGRISGRQEINLQSPYCTSKLGTPIHELMHALGFLHEQSRWERDDYVVIHWENVKLGHQGNFKKADKGSTDGYGVPYDYNSVMHYSAKAFSMNGLPTIVAREPKGNEKMGQRDGFSRGDILKINKMYACPNGDPSENKNPNQSFPPSNNQTSNLTNNLGSTLMSIISQLFT